MLPLLSGVLAADWPSNLRLPCVGRLSSPLGRVVVVGTAHTPCQSEAEVSHVISTLKPEMVVLELDQERLDLLLDGSRGRAVLMSAASVIC